MLFYAATGVYYEIGTDKTPTLDCIVYYDNTYVDIGDFPAGKGGDR